MARDLAERLRGYGLAPVIYAPAGAVLAVLSVTPDLTVWTDGTRLRWNQHGISVTWPASDTGGAAARLAALSYRHGPGSSPG